MLRALLCSSIGPTLRCCVRLCVSVLRAMEQLRPTVEPHPNIPRELMWTWRFLTPVSWSFINEGADAIVSYPQFGPQPMVYALLETPIQDLHSSITRRALEFQSTASELRKFPGFSEAHPQNVWRDNVRVIAESGADWKFISLQMKAELFDQPSQIFYLWSLHGGVAKKDQTRFGETLHNEYAAYHKRLSAPEGICGLPQTYRL